MPTIVIYSSTGCPYCEKIKNELKEWGYTYEERNVTDNPKFFDDLHEQGMFSTPVVFIDGEAFIGYRPKKMKKALGVTEDQVKTTESSDATPVLFEEPSKEIFEEVYDFVAIGGGPAGTSAAVYAARARLKTLIIDKSPSSGTLAITHKIANYPGVPGEVTGQELLEKMHIQAKDFGTTMIRSNVLSVDFSDEDIKKLVLPEGTIKAKSVFIAVGAKAPGSKIKGEEEFTGRGVSYCSTCDAAFFADRAVAVVGDTDEAVHESLALAKFAREVLLLVPTNKFKGDANIDELKAAGNVTIYYNHRLKEIHGDKKVQSLLIRDADKNEVTWEVDGVFLYLAGLKPGTDFLQDSVKRDSEGYVVVDETLKTSVDGVYAGGDARRTPIKQAVISAADGCIAALSADQHVNKRKQMRPQYS
ncbi:thioredoxin reductase (NADPH) [Bacillus mesophilus]|uniref:FAD-dependent oxidoreductase n=1 Tax=Bacillus mesophilus TaxID=1808955 RepID=A0A6M0QD30_9BACI|nr:FAD-dependent oxidoreductase [Bacillus mesophilus]MBM7662385.1 thioredoxin reductase (NADPH) [Bacillus mesophilus]NEY72988.1 FAD-dependent oxidoreductase [Bacillus mesophilus]